MRDTISPQTRTKKGTRQMSENVYDILEERGFIAQRTHPEELRELLGKEKVKFYIGFDATADSLTAGHFLTMMAMMHMQRAGHIPVALMGGGTTMVGDPSGKSDMRKMRMLTAECYKQRMEKGLTFFEFNYMIMQSYDFLKLSQKYGVCLQMGGDDQWSNIIGGVELIRKKEQKPAYGLTFKLLTTSEGIKMGKTAKGALWLDPLKTSPYEFFQYWRNIEDAKVEECLGLLTFLPMDEVRRLGALKDAEINHAKEVLAYEITRIVHGEEEAKKALDAARAVFAGGGVSDDMPTVEYTKEQFGAGIDVIAALVDSKIAKTRSEGRRLIEGSAVSVNDEKVSDVKRMLLSDDLNDDGFLILKSGKKKIYKISVK